MELVDGRVVGKSHLTSQTVAVNVEQAFASSILTERKSDSFTRRSQCLIDEVLDTLIDGSEMTSQKTRLHICVGVK